MCIHKRPTFEDFLKIWNGFRPGKLKGKYVIVCTKPDVEWRVAQLTTELHPRMNVPFEFLDGMVFRSVDAAQQAVTEIKARLGEA